MSVSVVVNFLTVNLRLSYQYFSDKLSRIDILRKLPLNLLQLLERLGCQQRLKTFMNKSTLCFPL